MAQIHAFLRLDPNRAPEQTDFVRSRANPPGNLVTILREAGGQFWVSMDEAQVDTFLSQGFLVSAFPDADVLHVGPLSFRPASERPQPPDALRATTPSGDDTGFWIVHFVAPADKSWLQEINLAGGEQVQFLDTFSGVFRMSIAVSDAVRNLAYVDFVALFHPAYAVGLDLAGVEEPFTAANLAGMSIHLPASAPEGNLQVSVFAGIDTATLQAAVQGTGANIVSETYQGFVVDCTPEQAQAVLGIPGILSAGIPAPKDWKNHNAGVILGVNQIRDIGTVDFMINLDGQGEIGAVVESGFDVGQLAGMHPDLAASIRMLRNSNTPLIAALPVPDNDGHGTHVTGTVIGNGASSGGVHRGMAPGTALIGLSPYPNNIGVTYDFAAAQGVRVINNSWGVTHGNGRYSVADALPLDQWCWRNPDVVLVFAAGNDESDTFGGSDGILDARTLDQEATAKNVFAVGSSENLRNDGGWPDSWRARFPTRYNHAAFNLTAGGAAGAFTRSDNANEVALNSDRGNVRNPTGPGLTGRVKPDVVAPGTNVLSTRSQLLAAPPALLVPPPVANPANAPYFESVLPPGVNRNLYQILSGTSMATPMVTGSALLVRQFYRTRFAQMRRPLLLEGVGIPAAPPLPVFGNQPAECPHVDGLVCAWLTPALPGAPQNIVAMRLGRHMAPVDAAPVHLQDNVGDHAAPKIVSIGERTYLLHRHGDAKMRLSCYDRTLHLVPGFGTAGVVTLSPDARPDDGAPPDLLAVGDQVACVFPAVGANGYFFQRFHADTGNPVDAASINFLNHDGTGAQHPLNWNGGRFAVCGVAHPGNFQLLLRQMDPAGELQGAGPITLLDQVPEIREPSLLWDPRVSHYLVVWCDARNVPGGEIWRQFLDIDGTALGAAQLVVQVPPANHVRRPVLLRHPESGYALLWEDDTQNGHFDLYFTLLDANGQVDGRIPADASDATNRRLVRISDTPADTAGYAALGDADGFMLVYQSPDEINSDRLGIYTLNLTMLGKFEAQEDPSTPLLKSGSYVTANLLDHDSAALTALSAVWAGGCYYLLRLAPGVGFPHGVQWVRLHADGAVDTSYGVNGIVEIPAPFLIRQCETLWTGNDRLITAVNDDIATIILYLHDASGTPMANFGTAGATTLQDTVTINDQICPQIGFFTVPSFHIVVGYGTTQGGALQLRQQRINSLGVRVGSPMNLAAADGVAAHNWFQFVNGEGRSIAIYHRVNGVVTQVHCRRFHLDGTPDGAESHLSIAAGEAINGVLARRPTAVDSSFREYAAAWQYRANNAVPWEIHFSRLDRQARPMAAIVVPLPVPLPVPAPPPNAPIPVSDVAVISAATPGWTATRSAIEPQLVCTYTHHPWTANVVGIVPEWSPAYGLAWIGAEADASRVLYFTVLDENGRTIALPPPPPPAGPLNAPVPVGILQVSATGTRVQNFKLVWNGRAFLLNWVEEENGHLHHKCTVVNRHANQNANDIPSAALLRATVVNGATNITPGPLPDTAAGYGWGRVNLRQSLAPAPPVTLHVRDDCAIGPGRTVRYHFTLPAGTALLRVTLNWTDPPGPSLVNHLHLTVRAPAPPGPGTRPEYRGNLWSAVPGQTHLSRPIPNPPALADNHEDIQTFKQVALENPPAGDYEIEVAAAVFPFGHFNQQNLQAFALVFAGTGPDVRFVSNVAAVTGTPIY
jgi:subtilisin family serine protease